MRCGKINYATKGQCTFSLRYFGTIAVRSKSPWSILAFQCCTSPAWADDCLPAENCEITINCRRIIRCGRCIGSYTIQPGCSSVILKMSKLTENFFHKSIFVNNSGFCEHCRWGCRLKMNVIAQLCLFSLTSLISFYFDKGLKISLNAWDWKTAHYVKNGYEKGTIGPFD